MAAALALPPEPRYPDSRQYLAVARNVRAGRGPLLDARHRAFRAPGYPLLVAGLQAAIRDDLLLLRIAQALLMAGLPGLVWLLGRELGAPRAALLAAGAAAVWPHFVYFSPLVLTEMPLALLLVAATWALLAARNKGSAGLALGGGLLLGIATLTHFSLAFYLAALLPVWLLARPAPDRPWRLWLLALAGWTLALAPWTARNARVLGAFVPFSTHAGEHLWEVLGPEATGGPMVDSIRHWPEGLRELGEVERQRLLVARTREHVLAHPGQALALAPKKLARLWSPLPNDPGHRRPALVALSLASAVPAFLLAAVGLARAVRARRVPLWPLLLPLVYVSAVHATISMGSVRYRIPFEPFLLLLAGLALEPRAPSASEAQRSGPVR